MRFFRVLDFHRVLDRFAQHNGRGLIHDVDVLVKAREGREVQLRLVCPNRCAGGNARDVIVNAVIRHQLYAVGRQRGFHLIADRLLLRKEQHLFLFHRREGQQIGIVSDVCAAQVQQPGDFAQRGQQQHVRAVFRHVAADEGELFLRRHARLRVGQAERGLCGKRGAIRPDLAHQILVNRKARMAARQRLFEVLRRAGIDHTAVVTQAAALGQLFRQELLHRGNARLRDLHQLDAGAAQLVFRLNEVTAVRPKLRLVLEHHADACRSGKTRKIRACLKMLAHIFRLMEVGRRHHVRIHPLLRHPRAKGFQLLICHFLTLLLIQGLSLALLYTLSSLISCKALSHGDLHLCAAHPA